MSMSLIAVIFLFICGCLAGLAVLIRSAEWFGAGFLAVLMVAGLLLFSSVYSPSGQVDSLRSEISDLKSRIETLKDMANNPAYLAGICLAGASFIVFLMFCGVYGLMIVQSRIRRAERQERTDRAGYLPQGTVRTAVVSCPEPVQALPEYRTDDRAYAVTQYQGY